LDNTVSQQGPAPAADTTRGPWTLAAAGLVLFALAWTLQGDESRFWLPGLGMGVALVAWLGWRMLPALALVLLVVRAVTHASDGIGLIAGDSILHILLIGMSWWVYRQVAHGSPGLDDPNSATLFLILVPGGLSAFAAIAQAGLLYYVQPGTEFVITAARLAEPHGRNLGRRPFPDRVHNAAAAAVSLRDIRIAAVVLRRARSQPRTGGRTDRAGGIDDRNQRAGAVTRMDAREQPGRGVAALGGLSDRDRLGLHPSGFVRRLLRCQR
jgi:hypothetical protein